MKRSFPEKLAMIWTVISLTVFIGGIILLQLEVIQEETVIGNIYGIMMFVLLFGFSVLAVYLYKKGSKYKFQCPKCGFIFKSLSMGSVFGDMGDIMLSSFWFVVNVIFKSRSFLRCPKCRKFSWMSITEDVSKSND